MTTLQRRNVYLIRRNFDEQTRLPERLVVETERQRAISIDTWKKAKAAQDFYIFKTELEKLFELKKQAAEILMDAKKVTNPYDALIDTYEPKTTSDTIASVFEELRGYLTRIIEKCLGSTRRPNESFLKRKVPLGFQEEISKSIAEFMEYDIVSKEAGGRIDETEHPFTTGYYDDVRITTHYYESDVTSSIFSVLHEGGHAKYEQGLRREWMYQPIGTSCSCGFHESQSQLVEKIIGHSTEFWTYYLPILKSHTGNLFSDVSLDEFVRAVNLVKPSKIRIEADEVTYNLHIIIRFEIERDLFSGKVKVSELPRIWNEKYLAYLGVKIENDSEGVMQDTHWAEGDFGYFPSYALGNIYSGQIISKMTKDIPNWREQISQGSFRRVGQWLTENIYVHGNSHDPLDLLRIITDEGINVDHYVEYLNSKYSSLYGY